MVIFGACGRFLDQGGAHRPEGSGHGSQTPAKDQKTSQFLTPFSFRMGTFSVYFPEVIFNDFLESSFGGPRWRFGAHGDQKVTQKETKRQSKTIKLGFGRTLVFG